MNLDPIFQIGKSSVTPELTAAGQGYDSLCGCRL